MRFIWAFPIAFVAGIHGFAMFAPYLLTVAGVGMVLRMRKPHPMPDVVRVMPNSSDLTQAAAI
jgi:hypothetical protein